MGEATSDGPASTVPDALRALIIEQTELEVQKQSARIIALTTSVRQSKKQSAQMHQAFIDAGRENDTKIAEINAAIRDLIASRSDVPNQNTDDLRNELFNYVREVMLPLLCDQVTSNLQGVVREIQDQIKAIIAEQMQKVLASMDTTQFTQALAAIGKRLQDVETESASVKAMVEGIKIAVQQLTATVDGHEKALHHMNAGALELGAAIQRLTSRIEAVEQRPVLAAQPTDQTDSVQLSLPEPAPVQSGAHAISSAASKKSKTVQQGRSDDCSPRSVE